jgi:hypothetical protein
MGKEVARPDCSKEIGTGSDVFRHRKNFDVEC